ncbi:MAG: flippase-like domain-containing protein [Prevotella sp.]|nr:flippase-like domain-containing protein [Prevotella sp.]
METKQILTNTAKIALPLVLGGAILYWMYRDFDFQSLSHVLWHEMDWTWMLLSFPFGVLAQAFRGWRWRQTLEPVGERPRTSTSINAVFLSYAASLVIPRIGEFTRCAVLKRYDGVSFSKALGTVVTERAVDSLVVLLFSGITLLLQVPVFRTFFSETGTSVDSFFERFSLTGYMVTAICGAAVLLLLHILLRKLSFYDRVRATLSGIWQGVISLKNVRNVPLFIFFTLGIWISYFLHYYLTFFCFDFTEHLGLTCAMVTFVVGSIAVIVPTPNGAGPWHFAVKTMLILYGVADTEALYFVLIVHTVQTMLVILLGVWAWISLWFSKRTSEGSADTYSHAEAQSPQSMPQSND